MTLAPFVRPILAVMATALLLLSGVATAHEAHKKDMTDAEISQMEHSESAVQVDAVTAMQNPDTAVQARQNVYQQQTGQQALEAKIAENRVTSLSDFLGRLHPVAAHFPIALLLIAALAELLLFLRPTLGLDTTVRFLVAGGAIGALVAALLGWFAAGWRLQDRSETLGLHRWNGTAIAGLALIAAWLAFRARNRSGLRIVLAVLAFAMIFQGYLGGEMVFGPNHLGLE